MPLMQPLCLIWAMNEARAIGRQGGLPWHITEDLKHFRKTTEGHAVIMGRRTWDEVGKPLPKRTNVVVSRSRSDFPGATAFASLTEAIAFARQHDPSPFVIGGAEIYRESLPFATDLYITMIPVSAPDADTFFPTFDEAEWHEVSRREGEVAGLVFLHWQRV
jgi:dihydrofolate reductase